MIIGFLGKGGSGKSTLATLMTNYLYQTGNKVLAIDADHNMDLAYNLGFTGNGPYIGGTFLPLREKLGISYDDKTDILFAGTLPTHRFHLEPADDYTIAYTTTLKPNLHLMMAGPQNEEVKYGSHCSHSLAAPLKIYLPLLDLQDNEYVVVDEKASVDAVTTGIPTGFDLAVVVAEPREHSLRVANQIGDMLSWYEIPYLMVLNKVNKVEDITLAQNQLKRAPDIIVNSELDPLTLSEAVGTSLKKVIDHSQIVSVPNQSRLHRTQKKYRRNLKHTEGV